MYATHLLHEVAQQLSKAVSLQRSAENMEKSERNKEIQIDLMPVLKAIWSKLWLIVLVGVLFAGMAFAATKVFIKPTYRCSFTAYVNNQHKSDSLSYQDINAGKQLVDTYVNVIRSNKILTAAAESIGLDIPVGTLKSTVTASVQGETEVIAVNVEHRDPQTAYILANAIANTAPAYMSDIVEGSSMKIIDYPVYSDKRFKPNYIKYLLLGFLLGAVLVIIKVIVSTLTDDKVKSVQDIEDRFSLPILGVIPDVLESTDEKGKGYYAYEYSERSSSKDKDGKQGEK